MEIKNGNQFQVLVTSILFFAARCFEYELVTSKFSSMHSLVLRGARAGLNYAIGGVNFGRSAMKMRGSRPLRAMFSGDAGGGGGEVGGRKGKFGGIRLNEAALADLVGVVCEDTGVENLLEGVAELDHNRRERTNFPEVGKVLVCRIRIRIQL